MLLKIQRYVRRNNGIKGAITLFIEQIKMFGVASVFQRITGKTGGMISDYQYWIENIEEQYDVHAVQKEIRQFAHTPLVSVLMPVYNVEEVYLRACIDSIIGQYYENWELCIADDCSTKAHVKEILDSYMLQDARIHVVYRAENGHISKATNSALEIAKGTYIALIDNDDMMKPEALFEVVKKINKYPDADMLYSDEDKVDATGTKRIWPAFKPDWSPDAFRCQMYIGHLGVYKTEIARKIGGFRHAFVGSQDYDFALRFVEHTDAVYHVAKVLYHWRMIPTSTAMGTDIKDYAFDASFQAKEEVIERNKIQATQTEYVVKHSTSFNYQPVTDDMVSIIVQPGDEQLPKLAETLQNWIDTFSWENYEILLSTRNVQSAKLAESLCANKYLRIVDTNATAGVGEFTELLLQSNGAFIMLLGAESKVLTPNVLETMIGQAKQPYTGVVGGRIINEKSFIESAGLLFLTSTQRIGYSFYGYHEQDVHAVDRLTLNFNYLAFPKELMLFEKQKLVALLDTQELAESFYAIDIALLLHAHGYHNVYRGDVLIQVQQSLNKHGNQMAADLTTKIYQKWGTRLAYDPYYNIHFSQTRGDYTIELQQKNKIKGQKL